MTDPTDATLRIDKWLWAVRLYKTRSLAAQAVTGGRVQVNGQRVKAAKAIRIDDQIELSRDHGTLVLQVRRLIDKRVSAPLAQACYDETDESRQLREANLEALRVDRTIQAGLRGDGRPERHARRQIMRLKTKNQEPT